MLVLVTELEMLPDNKAPQSPQNLDVAGFSIPHFGQRSPRALPHCEQNFFAAGFCVPQCEQSMAGLFMPRCDYTALLEEVRNVALTSLTTAEAPSRIRPASAQTVTKPKPMAIARDAYLLELV